MWMLWPLGLLAVMLNARVDAVSCYGGCDCHIEVSGGLISCVNQERRMIPNFGPEAFEAYSELDMRHNLIKEVDLSILKGFKVVDLSDNLLDCYDGVLNLELRREFKLLSDCDDIWNALSNDQSEKIRQKDAKDKNSQDSVSVDTEAYGYGHGYGNVKARAKGEMKVQWGFSMTLTVFTGIAGVSSLVAFYRLRKSVKKLMKRLRALGIDKNSDDEAGEERERAAAAAELEAAEANAEGGRRRRRPAPPPPRPSVFKRFLLHVTRNSRKKPTDDVILPGEVPSNLNTWMSEVNQRVAENQEQLSTLVDKIDTLNIQRTPRRPLIAPPRLSPASMFRAKYGAYRDSRAESSSSESENEEVDINLS